MPVLMNMGLVHRQEHHQGHQAPRKQSVVVCHPPQCRRAWTFPCAWTGSLRRCCPTWPSSQRHSARMRWCTRGSSSSRRQALDATACAERLAAHTAKAELNTLKPHVRGSLNPGVLTVQGHGHFSGPEGQARERLALDAVIGACKKLLAAYPVSMQSDQESLEALRSPLGRVPREAQRTADILRLRIQEQRVLNKTIFSLQQRKRPLSVRRT